MPNMNRDDQPQQPQPKAAGTVAPAPEVVEAIGKVSEAFEFVERARGHLYTFHQLMGHADLQFGEACQLMDKAGLTDDASMLKTELVGRNVLDGRWTFQVIEEFDDLSYTTAASLLHRFVDTHLQGERHAHEREMKEQRRTAGHPAHEMYPPERAAT